MRRFWLILLPIVLFAACGGKTDTPESEEKEPTVQVPSFSGDSAKAYVERQCSFGPRVPGSKAHSECLEWLVAEFWRLGADTVCVQRGEANIYDGSLKPIANVIASFNPDAENRILLASHWDSRPYADQDAKESERRTPILGADDGASGVGVLMELARVLGENKPTVGIDIVFFDLEDWGAPDWGEKRINANDWCLGSQYWAMHKAGYKAQFGILLDMVGGSNACFYREYFSEHEAKWVNDKVWNEAARLGLGHRFIDSMGGAINDDHNSVMEIGGIPCIDIISYNANNESGFPEYWHTHHDDISNISARTLEDVGTVLLNIIF